MKRSAENILASYIDALHPIIYINNSDYLKKARKYGHFTGYKN
jgi:hypothetical protein